MADLSLRPAARGAVALGLAVTGLLAGTAWVGEWPVAHARPVTIGVYQELPFGVARSHPSVTDGGRSSRDGRSTARLPVREPSVRYRVEVGARHVTAPIALTNNTLLAVAADHAGYVLLDGALTPDGASLRGASGVSLSPEGFVVAETDGLAFLDSRLQVRARVPVAGLSDAAPLVFADGTAVVSAGASLLRVDAAGTRRFTVPVASRAHSPVARTPSGRIVTATTTELLLLDQDGRVERREPLGDHPVAGPAVGLDGSIWVMTAGGLAAFDADGAPRVRVPSPTSGPLTHGGLAIATDGSVRAAVLGFGVLALNASAAPLWSFALPQARFVVVDAAGGSLVATHDGLLVALDADGQERWRARLDGTPHAAPVLGVDGTVYVGLEGGSLVALH
ncbi:MAG: PQQ-like beta-propeller repeat protein [Sandaracinaceae bacterium]|nr:PQQ-like beta-propeller repeat protein [Sandaracinaceae bacterium]MBK7777521.1 PQQ-like beta-propeller repeat protein [Sandaracinaceae bacterium]MBK8410068.1 PQQ-like beta-propeller repeat protein [Sandaracinaceae bacterium]